MVNPLKEILRERSELELHVQYKIPEAAEDEVKHAVGWQQASLCHMYCTVLEFASRKLQLFAFFQELHKITLWDAYHVNVNNQLCEKIVSLLEWEIMLSFTYPSFHIPLTSPPCHPHKTIALNNIYNNGCQLQGTSNLNFAFHWFLILHHLCYHSNQVQKSASTESNTVSRSALMRQVSEEWKFSIPPSHTLLALKECRAGLCFDHVTERLITTGTVT